MALVAAWRASGTTNAAFARRHGIHPRTFWGWCQREPGDQAHPSAAPVRFVPVTLVEGAAEGSRSEVEIVLASGDRVCVRGGLSAELLAHVVMALRRPC
jgi:transposase-like protein